MREPFNLNKPSIRAAFLGRVAFNESWDLQKRLWTERAEGRLGEDVFLFLEHNPVMTLGKGGSEANVLLSRSPVDGAEVPLVRINRGGEVTFHGPGQLMLYAICDLRERERDVHLHCRRLEEVFLRYLEKRGFHAERKEGNPGLWVGGEKILALGVGARRWVTMHGVSFNASPDLRYFEMMHPCGEVGGRTTSLEKLLGDSPLLPELAQDVIPICADVFDAHVVMETDPARVAGVLPSVS